MRSSRTKMAARKVLFSAVALAMWGSLPVVAQTTTQEPARLKTLVSAEALPASGENTQVLTRQDLDDQQVQNLEDLVRYIPGVEVDNLGRFGTLGFNIRGLDGDRVAISLDGLSLGETFNPPSYAPYDFFAAGRGGIDTDALKAVQVIKGADAVLSGSGALGGAVVFVTKDPEDYLAPQGNDTHLGIKVGYNSANAETQFTATAANRTGALESLLVYTGRKGHETESYYSGSRPDIPGTAREIPDPLDYRNDNLLLKLYYYPTAGHRLGLVVEDHQANSQLDAQSRLNSSYLTRTSDDDAERQRYGINHRWQADVGPFDVLEWRYDYQRSYNVGQTHMTIPQGCPAGISSPAINPCFRVENRDYEQERHTLQVDLSKTLEHHQIRYGASAERKELDFSHTLIRYVGTTSEVGVSWPRTGTEMVPNTEVRNYSLYFSDLWSLLADQVQLSAGIRYDRYEYSPAVNDGYQDSTGTVRDVSFAAPGWHLGVTWQPVEQHRLWAQVGGGFRAPTVEDLYFFPATTTATEVASGESVELWSRVSNPELDAETSQTFEVGYRWQSSRQLLSVSAFRQNYDGFIEYTDRVRNPDVEYQTCTSGGICSNFVGNEYQLPDNIGKAHVQGVELEGQWLLTRDLMARLAYSWLEGEEEDGKPLESVAPSSAVLGLIYQSQDDRWGLEARLTYSAGKSKSETQQDGLSEFSRVPVAYFDNGNNYTLVDLIGRYRLTPDLTLNLGVYNLFDEEYIRWQRIRFVTEGNAAGGVRGGISEDGLNRYTEPGRNYRATLEYRF